MTGTAAAGRGPPPEAGPALSARLRALPAGQPVAVAVLAQALGSRVHGATLALLALPEAIPLPLPSLSAVLGLPLLALSLHLVVHGEDGHLPGWIGRRELSPRIVALVRTRFADLVQRGERLSRPRWAMIAGRERLIGGLCAVLSAILLLPLPLFNTPPAICLALLAWGLARRDGLFVVAGAAGALLVVAALVLGAFGLLDVLLPALLGWINPAAA